MAGEGQGHRKQQKPVPMSFEGERDRYAGSGGEREVDLKAVDERQQPEIGHVSQRQDNEHQRDEDTQYAKNGVSHESRPEWK
jgi:hypothetical protein